MITMKYFDGLTSSSLTYIKINPSSIIVNFISFRTSLISIGKEQDLFIDPEKY
jgi:hypothetical protein